MVRVLSDDQVASLLDLEELLPVVVESVVTAVLDAAAAGHVLERAARSDVGTAVEL